MWLTSTWILVCRQYQARPAPQITTAMRRSRTRCADPLGLPCDALAASLAVAFTGAAAAPLDSTLLFFSTEDLAMGRLPFGRRPEITRAKARCQAPPCGISQEKSGLPTGLAAA